MEKVNISVNEAKKEKLFYVVANIIIVDKEKASCLLLKRSDSEKVLPGKWVFPGGKLEHDDVISLLLESGNQPIDGVDDILSKLASREAKEECGLIVSADNAIILSNKVFIRPDKIPVFMTTLVTSYEGGTLKLEEGSIVDSAWVNESDIYSYDCPGNVKTDAVKALQLI
jgi:8-oxo-dGTP pyrophosphatase MutT (NUDIX family)